MQNNPNGYLDLWARDHRKSTIITYAKTIQDILASHGDDPIQSWWGDREITSVIFSFSRPIAKKFLEQIKNELQDNAKLKAWFPDILYADPKNESDSWSLDNGLNVKRKDNPKEKTIEAYGIIDSMPTGGHWMLRVYDDVITEKVARNPDIVAKSVEQWELSLNLGTRGGVERYIGTRYSYNDAYKVMMQRGAVEPRIYPATIDGKPDGKPVYLTDEELADKRKKMGIYTFNSQMLQNPYTDDAQGFQRKWLKFTEDRIDGTGMNKILLVDPAGEKKKSSDYTTMIVWGLGADHNFYVLDMVRDKLNLGERTNELIRLHQKWRPYLVGYEKYGKDSDIEHIKMEQADINYRFDIEELGGRVAKNDRIKRLIPHFEEGRIYLPPQIARLQYDGKHVDLIEQFLNEEYDMFPLLAHDDMLDVMARLYDVNLRFPKIREQVQVRERYGKRTRKSWMSSI